MEHIQKRVYVISLAVRLISLAGLKKTQQGTVKGERYARTLKKDKEGKIFKDHWELKGKAT